MHVLAVHRTGAEDGGDNGRPLHRFVSAFFLSTCFGPALLIGEVWADVRVLECIASRQDVREIEYHAPPGLNGGRGVSYMCAAVRPVVRGHTGYLVFARVLVLPTDQRAD